MKSFLQLLVCGLLTCALTGCGDKQLGSPDNPAKFTAEVLNEFDAQIKEVNDDDSLSDEEKAKRIKEIEVEQEDFNKYNMQDGQDG